MNYNNTKRVYCLYRVSTKGQVDKNDIPMQKQSCRAFAEQNGWTIVKELSEKGLYDILLVFMFDRIGRRHDETPFVVEWLSKKGIEVWSVNEGHQRFESHVDALINFLHFWQASGESGKTSIRTKTRLAQIVKEGRFRGGTCPYGYKLVKRGRLNKRNHEVYEIEIDENESEVVKLIFNKYVYEGYGAYRLAKYLTSQGIVNRSGKIFTNTTIQGMLHNPIYMGILRSGETRSEIFPELQIIPPETFNKVEQIRKDRVIAKSDTPFTTKGIALLSGLVHCADCGRRLVLSSVSGHYIDKNKRARRAVYLCHHQKRHPEECHNQVTYSVAKLDGIVEEVVISMFERMESISSSEVIEKRYEDETQLAQAQVSILKKEYEKLSNDLSTYKSEIGKVLRGESKWDGEILRELTEETRQKLAETECALREAEYNLADCDSRIEEIREHHKDLISWAEIYSTSTIESKKMILAKLIERVNVKRNYETDIIFRISYAQFFGIDETKTTE